MLVVGDREQEERAAALRRHGEGDLGTMPIAEAVGRIAEQAAERIGSPEAAVRTVAMGGSGATTCTLARPCAPVSILPRVDQAFPHSSAAYSLTPRRTAIA